LLPQAALTEERTFDAMKYKALFGLRLVLGLLLFASGSGQTGGLGLVVQQIETIGPRQWLSLMAAGSIVFSAPVSQRIARAFRRRFVPFADGGIIGGNTA
jgi:hypothetical protein